MMSYKIEREQKEDGDCMNGSHIKKITKKSKQIKKDCKVQQK